jgi:hypothetical protein
MAILFLLVNINAQTTSFSYQGRLTDAGSPANGSFQMQFKLFDAAAAGAQIGTTLTDVPVTVTAGSFSIKLDFGAGVFAGGTRFIEVAVRHNSGESYVTLGPREQIVSSPYGVRTLSTAMADDSQKLGGVAASEYVTTSTVGSSFINNNTAPQTANFNITGNGRVGGNFGIGTATPNAGLEIRGTGAATQQRITDTASGNSLVLQGGAGGNMKITGFNYNTFTAVPLYFSVDGANTIFNSGGGNVGVGLTSPATKLSVFSDFYGISHTDGTRTLSTFINSSGAWLGTRSNHSLHFFANDSGERMTLTPAGNVGIGTVNPTQKLHVVGTVRTSVLQVTAGSDLAENFAVDTSVEPGMVVAIDPLYTGKLVLSRGAYNKRVAGIVSGANNLSAGMLLPDLNEGGDSMPIALSGRVWVHAVAGKVPIRPGDLLTTSTIPGHAMKVRDHRRAQGAIIGKAMSELKSGTGLVLVLVSLQ